MHAGKDPALVVLVVGVQRPDSDPERGDEAEQERNGEPRPEAAGPASGESRLVDDGRLERGGHGALVILAGSGASARAGQ